LKITILKNAILISLNRGKTERSIDVKLGLFFETYIFTSVN